MTKRKILLLSPTSVDGKGIGSIFLRDMIAGADEYEFQELGLLSSRINKSMFSKSVLSIWNRFGALRAISLLWFEVFQSEAIAQNYLLSFEEKKLDEVLIVAANAQAIHVGEMLRRKGLPVRVLIWDAPEYLMGPFLTSLPVGRRIMLAFANILQNCKSAAVISEAMREEYFARFGTKATVLRHGLREVDRRANVEKQELGIVFAGSLYSKTEWNAFVSCLQSCDWAINGRAVELHYIGQFPRRGAIRPLQLIEHGECDLAQALDIMSKQAIGYLPYWFSPLYERVARTSFPGKISAYAASGLVVFNHAPEYVEVTGLLKKFPFGVNCHSCDLPEILKALSFAASIAYSDEAAVDRRRAMTLELSLDVMVKRTKQFLE